MSNQKTLAQTFADVWPTMADAMPSDADLSSTIRPSLGDTIDLPAPEADQPIPSPPSAVGRVLELLGEGGMGIVDRVEQRSLGRWVARKQARPDARGRLLHRLLQEAWVSGFLEHPNIVPIYDIASDESGRPQILMREISGLDWEVLLEEPEALKTRFGPPDVLDWHLRVLLQVCNAVSYAHDKDIIHRDLKPENVMVGPFGEVWVLDWGLAVAVTDVHSAWIPRAANERRLAGTPRYMAPEMIVGDGALLSKQTDVYLLGAILHEVLTGHPPHDGEDLHALLAGIPDWRPRWPATAPASLCAIAEKALAPRPEDRHASVEAFRRELQSWLDTRRAIELAEEARAQLQELQELISEEAERQRLYTRLSAARFGFQQALREWPEHPDARAGLADGLLMMIRWELAQENPHAAEALLAELETPAPELEQEASSLRLRMERDARRFERLKIDRDHRVGVRTRIFLSLLVGLVWLAFPAYAVFVEPALSWEGLIQGSVVIFVTFLALAIWARDSMSKSALNRATVLSVLAVPITQSLADLQIWWDGGTPMEAYEARMVVWATLSVMYAVTVSARMFPSAIAYCSSVVLGQLYPEWTFEIMLVANMVLIANMFVVWAPLWFAVVRKEGLLYGRFRDEDQK